MLFTLYGNEDFVSISSVNHITQEAFSDDDFFASLSNDPLVPAARPFVWVAWRPPESNNCAQQLRSIVRDFGLEGSIQENDRAFKRLRMSMREISSNFPSILSLYPFWKRQLLVKNIAVQALFPSDLEEYEWYITSSNFHGLFEKLDLMLVAEQFESFVCKKLSLENSHQKLKMYFDASQLRPFPVALSEALESSLRHFSRPEVQAHFFGVCRQCVNAAVIGEGDVDAEGEGLLVQFRNAKVPLWECALQSLQHLSEQRFSLVLGIMEKAIERQYSGVVEHLKRMISSAVVYTHFKSRGKVFMLSGYYDVAAIEAMSREDDSMPAFTLTPPQIYRNVFSVQDTRRFSTGASLPVET